jgi:hypothetical protein
VVLPIFPRIPFISVSKLRNHSFSTVLMDFQSRGLVPLVHNVLSTCTQEANVHCTVMTVDDRYKSILVSKIWGNSLSGNVTVETHLCAGVGNANVKTHRGLVCPIDHCCLEDSVTKHSDWHHFGSVMPDLVRTIELFNAKQLKASPSSSAATPCATASKTGGLAYDPMSPQIAMCGRTDWVERMCKKIEAARSAIPL